MSRLRILTVSHAAVVDVNQKVYAELARLPGVEVGLVAPRSWKTELHGRRTFRKLPDYEGAVFLLSTFCGRDGPWMHLHFHLGATRVLREFRPEVVFVEEEPYSLATWQWCWLAHKRGFKVLFHSNQNLLKRYPFPCSAWERKVYQTSDGAVVVTQEVAEVLRQKGYEKTSGSFRMPSN